MTNVCMKFEKAGPNQTLVIDLIRKCEGRTDGRTDGQTGAKQHTPSSSKGGVEIDLLKSVLILNSITNHLIGRDFLSRPIR